MKRKFLEAKEWIAASRTQRAPRNGGVSQLHLPSSRGRQPRHRERSVVCSAWRSVLFMLAVAIQLLLSVDNVLADGAAASRTGGLLSMLPMLIILIVFMYFIIIRPQTKRAKTHKELMSSLQVGDEIVTIGGILGVIDKIDDNYVVLTITGDSKVVIQKGAVATILPRGTIKGIANK